jgi:hypothetical protein
MAWGSVLLADPEDRQDVFERVAPAGKAGGVDAAVVGQRARRRPVSLDNVKEHGHDRIARDRLVRRGGQQVAGVVIKPVENFNIGPIVQTPVDEVRLPHLVRLVSLEPQPR